MKRHTDSDGFFTGEHWFIEFTVPTLYWTPNPDANNGYWAAMSTQYDLKVEGGVVMLRHQATGDVDMWSPQTWKQVHMPGAYDPKIPADGIREEMIGVPFRRPSP
jgi:hypothetical protein